MGLSLSMALVHPELDDEGLKMAAYTEVMQARRDLQQMEHQLEELRQSKADVRA